MRFEFYGPTCDGLDVMPGPFYLPSDICEGDFIEIGQMGAYGRTLATTFNGFSHERDMLITNSAPLMTMFDNNKTESVALGYHRLLQPL